VSASSRAMSRSSATLKGAGASIQPHSLQVATALLTFLKPSVFNEDASHGLGCSGKEMAAAVPVLDLVGVHQPYVGLVNQGSGVQRLARLFLRHPFRCQLTQFVVDERQKLFS